MAFTDDQRACVESWFKNPEHNHTCPVCYTKDWGLVEAPVAGLQVHDMKLSLERPVLFVVVTCKNCGLTRLFNAKIMGDAE